MMGASTKRRRQLGGVVAGMTGLVLAACGGVLASAVAPAGGTAPGARAAAPGNRAAALVPAKAGLTQGNGPLPLLPELFGASCPSASWCMTVGTIEGAPHDGVSGIWTGQSWQWLRNPRKSGNLDVLDLTSVSCVSETSCVAVGRGASDVPVGVQWNGKSWALLPFIANKDTSTVDAVSCATATYCVVVGAGDVSHLSGASLLWNGTSWRRLGATLPAGANSISFDGVSCRSTTACLAVGSYLIGANEYPVTESWNGSTWTILGRSLRDVVERQHLDEHQAGQGRSASRRLVPGRLGLPGRRQLR